MLGKFRKKIKLYFLIRQLKRKIKEAEKLKAATLKQQFIIPVGKNKLGIVTKDYIAFYNKQMKGRAKQINFIDLCKMSFYMTK